MPQNDGSPASEKENISASAKKPAKGPDMKLLAGAALAIIIVAVAAVFLLGQGGAPRPSGAPNGGPGAAEVQTPQPFLDSGTGEPAEITPSSFAVRQRYFEEAFRPRRQDYDLFEKASEHLGIPIQQVPEFFSLNSEEEIFEQLPPPPEDFSEIAYLLASGRTYAIGGLSEEYFLQPEFYPGFKESGLKYWSEPDPKYWSTNGYGSYPGEQFDTLSHSGRRGEFVAVVFFYTGYGVQTYQGLTFVPASDSLNYFDIKIEPDTILLTPVFPAFSSDWAHQIVITGKLKPDTPPGEYTIGLVVAPPPKEKRDEWGFKYRNLYFDAATAIGPSGYPIKLNITVEE